MTRGEQIDELLGLLRAALEKAERLRAEEPVRVGFVCGLHTRNIVFDGDVPSATLYLDRHVPLGTKMLSSNGVLLGLVTSSSAFTGKMTYRVDVALTADQFKKPLVGMWDEVVTLHYAVEMGR